MEKLLIRVNTVPLQSHTFSLSSSRYHVVSSRNRVDPRTLSAHSRHNIRHFCQAHAQKQRSQSVTGKRGRSKMHVCYRLRFGSLHMF